MLSSNYEMDYKEEQDNEVGALESIYCGEMETLGADPHKFTIKIKADFDRDKEDTLSCKIKFTYTEKYPDELPVLELVEHKNFSEADINELMDFLNAQAKDNLGMVMVFTLVSSTQDWMSTRWDMIQKNKELEAERVQKEMEEEEMRKFEGARVTVESFMRWKMAFQEEIGMNKKDVKDEKEGRKLTGKELFLQDQSLAESDLRFLEEGGECVKVDESLFENLDDLGLDDSETED